MASHDARDRSSSRRLRIPTALAVALVGSSASIAVSVAGCDVPHKTPVVDATHPGVDAADTPDAIDSDAFVDAGVDTNTADAVIDAASDAPADARPDARPDAPVV
jgi:hypothetical protein